MTPKNYPDFNANSIILWGAHVQIRSELHWPTKYFPPCLRHDFDWIRGMGDWVASLRFYALQRAYGVPVWRSALRAVAVTFFWYGLGKWRRSAVRNAIRAHRSLRIP